MAKMRSFNTKSMKINGLKSEVDHDHSQTKEDEWGQPNLHYVRGLLCGKCNTLLGKLRDNRQTLQRLADYLKRHGDSLETFK